MVVLDTSAILALLWKEPGGDRVADLLPHSLISTVNLGEACSKMSDRGLDQPDIQSLLLGLPSRIVAFDVDQALESGNLRALTRHRGLSLGDRACLALAKRQKATAVTADRSWLELGLGIEVISLR